MSEINAAFGLLQLKHIEQALEQRKAIAQRYREALCGIAGIELVQLTEHSNNAYFPILVQDSYSLSRDELYKRFKENSIHVRRYFYPLISEFPMYRGLLSAQVSNLPTAKMKSEQILCLPIYPGLEESQQDNIIQLIQTAAN